ncbi:MAG: PqqD family protein [Capsulimonadaceae bacterium]|nr:PqqD family protein [Capsulimonadaceae bacterium]
MLTSLISDSHTLLPTRRELPSRKAGTDILVRNTDTGSIHFLNPTAAVIWNCCDGATTAEQCAERLISEFSIPAGHDIATDIRQIVATLVENGLVNG